MCLVAYMVTKLGMITRKHPAPDFSLRMQGEEVSVPPMSQLFREFTNGQVLSPLYRVLRTESLMAWGQHSTAESSATVGRDFLVG